VRRPLELGVMAPSSARRRAGQRHRDLCSRARTGY